MERLTTLLINTNTHISAPVVGGGIAWVAWAENFLPIISLISVVLGILLGLTTFVLRERRESKKFKAWKKEHEHN